MSTTNIIERAYELARSGNYEKVDHIEKQLSREGFSAVKAHLSGSLLRRQLNELIRQGRELRVVEDVEGS